MDPLSLTSHLAMLLVAVLDLPIEKPLPTFCEQGKFNFRFFGQPVKTGWKEIWPCGSSSHFCQVSPWAKLVSRLTSPLFGPLLFQLTPKLAPAYDSESGRRMKVGNGHPKGGNTRLFLEAAHELASLTRR